MLLVTGITGRSGRYFLRELIANKYAGPIRCVLRSSSYTAELDNSGLQIEKAIGDLTDQAFLDSCMIGVDTVLHFTSIFYSVNIMRAAVKNNVRRAILVHTTGIYSKYKSASEEYKNIEVQIADIIAASASSIGLTILRPTMIYGSVNDGNMIVFIKLIDKLRIMPVINRGESLIQPVNARDLGKAYYQVLIRPEITIGDYILSGEKPVTMLNMFKIISNALGKKTIFLNVPLSLGVFLAKTLKLITLGKVDYIERVQRMGEDRSYPHDAASRDFGYCPMTLEEGINIEVKQYAGIIDNHR